jgi:hypothetical protein
MSFYHTGSFEMKTTINDAATLIDHTHAAPPATFEIFTGNDLPSSNNRYLIGMAKMDGHGHLIPVATVRKHTVYLRAVLLKELRHRAFQVLASNQTTTHIKPKMKFYISRAKYPASFIVDFASLSRHAGVVDFSSGEGQIRHFAIVRFTQIGNFQVDYNEQPLGAQGKGLVKQGLEKIHQFLS